MLKEALLQLGLSEEQANNVLELHATTLKDYVPRESFDAAVAQNKADAERATSELAAYKMDSAITLQLTNAGVKNPKILRPLLDLSKISMDGESLTGLEEQLTELRESDDYLFHTDNSTLTGREPFSGVSYSVGENRKNPFKTETFNLTEQSRIIRDNPAEAARMKAAAGIS